MQQLLPFALAGCSLIFPNGSLFLNTGALAAAVVEALGVAWAAGMQ